MLKNNKGMTLVVLVITVLVIIILASISITSADSVLTKTRLQNAATNMKLIRAKIESLNEELDFSDAPEDQYVGTKCANPTELNYYKAAVTSTDKWYILTRDDLKALGFKEDLLKKVEDVAGVIPERQPERYIVNYSTGEVIFTTGIVDEDHNRIYTLTELMKLFSPNEAPSGE